MCIIVFKKIDNKNYIAKNRDKSILVNISIIHEIVDNVEIVYLFDLDTFWIEGMNEFGIGFVNSALAVKTDEIIDKSIYQKRLFNKKRNMLTNNKIENIVNQWVLSSKNNELNGASYDGHTLICNNSKCYHIETFQNEIPFQQNLVKDTVFTNHGINIKKSGYSTGKNYMSSLLRKELCYNEIKKIKSYSEILNCLNKNYVGINPEFHTYRNKKQTINYLDVSDKHFAFNTNSQILMCLNELKFYLNFDLESANFIKYDYRLPKDYVPKIKVVINGVTKSKKYDALPFDNTYITKISETYMYKKNKILFYCILLLFILIIFVSYKS
jgi:hypothetical protein